jgi:hypothetical protein
MVRSSSPSLSVREPMAEGGGQVCVFADDPAHECSDAFGGPVKPGGVCWDTARAESLRSFEERHPGFLERTHQKEGAE